MNSDLVTEWDNVAQPLIRKEYPGVVRADHEWEWLKYWRAGKWFQDVGYRNLGAASFWCITTPWAVTGQMKEAPVGMLYVAHRFKPGFVDLRPSLLWLLTAAPDSVFDVYGVPPLSLGKILVDCAIQVSLAAKNEGAIMLHADPAGGNSLMGFYAGGCKMPNLPQGVLISTMRKNDGRYFIFGAAEAIQFAKQFDASRAVTDLER